MNWGILLPPALLGLSLSLPVRASRDRPGDGQPDLEPIPENIDPHMYPLIVAMNAIGLCKTRASCEGHWESVFYVSQPYVAFHSDIQFAERLDAKVSSITALPWYVEAYFGFDRKLCYRLAINMEALNLFQRLLLLFRKNFDGDIQNIVKLVQALASDISQ